MARLLFTVWPYPTHLHPFLALARAARGRGHDVSFYTGGGGLAMAAGEGFRCFGFHQVDWGGVARTVDDLIAGRRRLFPLRRLWAKFLVETVRPQVEDLEAVLAEWPADGIICDIAMWGPILILHEKTGIPVTPFSHVANCILPGPEGPAPFAGLTARIARVVTAPTRRKASAVRRAYGLPPLTVGVNEFTGRLPLYLVPGAPEFDKNRRDLPPSVRYVGPCLWEAGAAPGAEKSLGAAGRSACATVVVDEGALYTHEPRVLAMAARGLAELPVTVVLLAGQGRELAGLKLGALAANVMLQPHIPLRDLLPRARVLVTNGNSESVLVALEAGVPLVVLPSIWDQAEMARRVAETGVGLRMSPWWATQAGMRRAVERVLAEPSFRRNAAAMGAALARYGGPARAVELIENLAGARRPQHIPV